MAQKHIPFISAERSDVCGLFFVILFVYAMLLISVFYYL